MRVSVRWLRQYLDFTLTLDELIETITMAGHEVEEARDLGFGSGKLVVARVLETEPHPDADRLKVCKVDAGQGEILQIVCGAPNATAGTSYVCALVGAELPDPDGGAAFKIKRSKIRGVESMGMLCSAKELGLGGDHSGIMAVPDEWTIGDPFDALLDIKVTPNRPDVLSMLGLARDIGAMIGEKPHTPVPRHKETLDLIEGFVSLSIKARGECPRYTCRLMRHVTVAPSPLWLQRTLEAAGLRPINNVVDVTNYVLLELGHPLHAFDFERLAGAQLNIRLANEGETMRLLNGREIALNGEDLVIADGERAVALAGIMGGENSEVGDETKSILLECAYFDPPTIRRTARRHGLQTDASYRFERGTDRVRMTLALNRAAQLIQELAGGEGVKGMLDVQGTIVDAPPIMLTMQRVNDLLGIKLSSTEVADYLLNLGFEIRHADRDSMAIICPSHRVDIRRDVDLIEEIARVHNYNNIPLTMPSVLPTQEPETAGVLTERTLRLALEGLGFSEALTYSFINEAQAAQVGADVAAQPRVANPLTVDHAIMRPAILPGLLPCVARNQNVGEMSIALFELGKIWTPQSRAGAEGAKEPRELALVLSGPQAKHWSTAQRETDFHDLKGVLETLLAHFGEEPLLCEPLTDAPHLHPGRAARLSWSGAAIGEIGELHPDLAAAADLRGRVYAARLDLDKLAELCAGRKKLFKAIPRFPGSQRDLALVVAADVPAGDLLQTVRTAGGALLEEVSLFDVYQGEHVEPGKKSVALRMKLRAAEKTLTEEEIAGVVNKIVKKLAKQHEAVLRA